jgi:ABC transport system ATP-binding/permease protein
MKVELSNTKDPEDKIVLDKLPAIIGQDTAADVRLADAWVAGCHCMIAIEGEMLVVLDMGSNTGTFIDGMRIRRAHLIPGDTLTVGRTSFLVEYEGESEVSHAPAPVRTSPSPK